MGKNITRFIYYWLPPLVWMSIIFYFSSFPRAHVSNVFTINFIFFKSLHVGEYAILYFLVFRAFNSISEHSLSLKHKLWMAVLVTLLYASSDEFHQTFIPTREGHVQDILIDAIGISLSFVYTKANLHFLKKLL